MELGVFSLTDIYPGSPDTAASRVDDIIGYGILAEQSGLDVFGIGEHHTRAFAVSSPAVVHAAIARATSRITLTTTATVLSVLDPPGVSGFRHARPGEPWAGGDHRRPQPVRRTVRSVR
jgi:Luciferase-like monooxygenase